ncbi:MAG: DUF262 domain-containing protein, partial [Vicinamibacterales bacterium]
SVLYVYSTRDGIWFDPPYQRLGDVWPLPKRQLLIDSILNGFDIPKLYFHEFFPPRSVGGRKRNYAIVDGKQRLHSIFEFIEGRFGLSNDFALFDDPDRELGGATYQDLAKAHPDLKARLDGFVLPIVTIRTADVDLIEDMFSRLNEAVPLNAAEKRNAFGGVLPPIVREIVTHPFFSDRLPFDNKRYRHYELATKFLYFEHYRRLRDTKKIHLDEFVKSYKGSEDALKKRCLRVLDKMAAVFGSEDRLLRPQGMIVLYYFLYHEAIAKRWPSAPSRSLLEKFETLRTTNRSSAEKNVAKADYELLEFERLAQSLNDAVALNYRYAVMRKTVGPPRGRPRVPGD